MFLQCDVNCWICKLVTYNSLQGFTFLGGEIKLNDMVLILFKYDMLVHVFLRNFEIKRNKVHVKKTYEFSSQQQRKTCSYWHDCWNAEKERKWYPNWKRDTTVKSTSSSGRLPRGALGGGVPKPPDRTRVRLRCMYHTPRTSTCVYTVNLKSSYLFFFIFKELHLRVVFLI